MSLADNIEFLKRLPKPGRLGGMADYARTRLPAGSPLVEVQQFGTNPGGLRMFAFVPEPLQKPPALVVVLHGCGQNAAGYDLGAGWSTLAKHCGFALLMPEQQFANNANGCFNWFNPDDIARGQGEAASIRQMIARMSADHGIDPGRIFVTGLSAGGAMTSVMLAAYPEVFAAGAIIAGLPYGVASNVREALTGMHGSRASSSHDLGDLVRKASHHKGKWPKLSVWHGSVDRVVSPANADEIVKQWLDVHGLPAAPMSEGIVNGHPHRVWWNADGETVVESYTITNMAHGTPLGLADNDNRYGTAGAFLIEAGISSSWLIAKFFGLTTWIRERKAAASKTAPVDSPSAKLIPKVVPMPAPDSIPMPDLSKVLWPLTTLQPRPAPAERKATAGEPATAPWRRRRCDHYPRAHRRGPDEVARPSS